ncbi:TetR/AcrR family transcriptional regulator [Cellulomonas denverensis]|uniref:TetR/AcrR family transcriptional regulator n=1 Tax=Cellulomonas denverensis TaxID=264297 RepID=A0A7X6KTD4_9CELL|nr:TetR/AcrR family transcriptional regulator [Cellulomonas denverensis]NKY21931.1 TetR/AcrR family transcriptional regulator [Cellulomonas denverensis]GIG24178.1 TetR family transcriptional regulator [Cellulomonas denverensis]
MSDTRTRRDPVRTRRALLKAAATAVAAHGAGVSVDVIARSAGVSKSGLLHHFGSKEQLFAALAQDAFDQFAAEVEAATDPADLAPGRLMRGYLRATFAQAADPDAADYWAVMAQLAVVPAVAQAARDDFRFWEDRLTADGFDPAVAQLVLLAAGGLELGEAVGWVPGDDRGALRDRLIRLTHAADTLRDVLSTT